ncbi:chaperonin 10-like protein [Lipomyces arxii]|uniref:chaperonin 10-like protein n=1 Tax=Lipomyces arxii TaxID=56418 RepID=UPI0034CDCE29
MKALRYYANKDVRFETSVPEPILSSPTDVLILPQWCGICGSDLHEFLDGPIFCPIHPHPLTHESVPITLGHEFCGIVDQVGTEVTHLVKGDKVCVEATVRCNDSCSACKSGKTNCCATGGFIGLSGWGGGLSEKVVVPSAQAFKLPDDMPIEYGALIEPLAVAWHAVKLAAFAPGMTALVLGSGPIGIATVIALKAFGAAKIYVSELAKIRRDQASEFDVDQVFNPAVDDVVKLVKQATAGDGVDVAFDCSGVQATFDTSLFAIKSGGTALNIAIWGKTCTYNPNDVLLQEKKVFGAVGYVGQDFKDVIQAYTDGKLKNVGKMITAKLPIEETVSVGYDMLINHKDQHIKILCTPRPELLQ